MGRIRVLPDDLINQIAAGEVVERPASVVKELAENAVDANARQIKVRLSNGGLSKIEVIDDGIGMSREDAVLCLSRHATSKLKDKEGLTNILTKGFRGEAIPAIASVSRFKLLTAEAGAAAGTQVEIEGGAPPLVSDAAPVSGTRIEVADLFFNVPARRKFMRREPTELLHCQEAVIRLALAHPEVGFVIEHDGRTLLASAPAAHDLKERIAAALGPEVHPHLLPVEERRLGITVEGFVASPEMTLSNARGLYTFVNHRYVRDRALNFAVQRAFQDTLAPGRQPIAVLFIGLEPATVDVNVHPQKLEVRFQDSRSVTEAVIAAIARALKAAPWRNEQAPQTHGQAHYALAVDRFLARASEPSGFVAVADASAPLSLGFGQARPTINEAPPPGYFGALRFLGDLQQRFWVCEGQGGSLVVIDPRAALQRVRLTQLREAADPTLFSSTVELSRAVREPLLKAPLGALGLELESFGGDTVSVRSVPSMLAGAPLEPLLEALSLVLPSADAADPELALDPARAVIAAHAATFEAKRRFGAEEAHALLRELDGADFSAVGLTGRVVVHDVPLLELQRRSER